MDYLGIFKEYLDNTITLSSAESKINKILPCLLMNDDRSSYFKATLCLTYFKRYKQYNAGLIKAKDFILFLRDFILFVGKFRFPRFVTDVVLREGTFLGVFVNDYGEIDVLDYLPESLKDQSLFVQDVYHLNENKKVKGVKSKGDFYVKRHTVFSSYRSLEQKLAVHSAVELPDNHTLMVSLPTGGGKSLITQILAAFDNKLTLVVVPTVSLAKDQYLQAKDCITDSYVSNNVFCYDSSKENNVLIDAISKREARLIFTSPEAVLKNGKFNQAIRDAANDQYLKNIVIDEAHIVPDWGLNFRPDFQIFSIVLKELREMSFFTIRTYLLSATLSDDVVQVLFDLYGSENNNIQFRCDSLRAEPRYVVVRNKDYNVREKGVLEMIKYLPKPLIVYVIEPDTAKKYCKLLNKEGFSNVYSYTGDTNDNDREKLLNDWKNNEFDVIIATSAFGMGVDKSNVRTIIHACVPESLSRFYQEVGRAGRDGLPSLSVLTYYMGKDERNNDLSVAFGLVKGGVLTKENLVVRFQSILNDREKNIIQGDIVIADLNTVPSSFTEKQAEHAGTQNMCWNVSTLLLLHRQGYINIQKALYDSKERTYLFVFKLNDIDLLQNSDRLLNLLAEDRQKEYDMQVEGYRKMTDIIRKTDMKCMGIRLVSLFPYAQPICSGCPIHPYGSTNVDDVIKIRKPAFVNVEPSPPSPLLRRYMGKLLDMLIPVDDYDKLNLQKVGDTTDKLDLGCLIYPDEFTGSINTNCMSLKYSEFLVVSKLVPWLFRKGLMIVLSDNNCVNNKIFEAVNSPYIVPFRKVWCAKLNTRINSKNRTINEFLNCHIRYLSNI